MASTVGPSLTTRVRASKPKVRSGCITCKIRRVKCDETRPGCLRCNRFGRECDGYTSDRSKDRRHSLAPLKPRPLHQEPTLTALPSPEIDQERCYYEIFCDRTAVDLAGYHPTNFWKQIVPQEGLLEPAVRHAIIALGALTKSIDDSGAESSGITLSGSRVSEEHHEHARSQYNRALVELSHIRAKDKPQIRTALIACLLFICFENFHSDHEAAARHMQCGLGLLEQWRAINPPEFVAHLYSEEVFQIFARCNAQSAQHLGAGHTSNPAPKLFYWESIGKGVVPIPLIFADIHEARMCWDVLQERCIDYHRTNSRYRHTTEQPHWVIAEADACALQLQHFEDTFWPLLNQSGDPHAPIHNSTTILYLHNKISIMQLQVSVVCGERHWDGFTQHFEEIITRASKVVEHSRVACIGQPAPFTSFELGIIPPLHLCATKCREPRLRRRAIALLLSYPRREGCWDGAQLGKLDTRIMQLEEEGLDDFGCVPEDSRWRVGDLRANHRERWIWAKLVRDSYDSQGRWVSETVVREEKIMT